MYKAKGYKDFAKVWRKYAKKDARKFHGRTHCFLSLMMIGKEELENHADPKNYVGRLVITFLQKYYDKKMPVDKDLVVTFAGLNFTNIGVFYVVKMPDGQLSQVHQSYLAFIR